MTPSFQIYTCIYYPVGLLLARAFTGSSETGDFVGFKFSLIVKSHKATIIIYENLYVIVVSFFTNFTLVNSENLGPVKI